MTDAAVCSKVTQAWGQRMGGSVPREFLEHSALSPLVSSPDFSPCDCSQLPYVIMYVPSLKLLMWRHLGERATKHRSLTPLTF